MSEGMMGHLRPWMAIVGCLGATDLADTWHLEGLELLIHSLRRFELAGSRLMRLPRLQMGVHNGSGTEALLLNNKLSGWDNPLKMQAE
jgi:hypothetical protein